MPKYRKIFFKGEFFSALRRYFLIFKNQGYVYKSLLHRHIPFYVSFIIAREKTRPPRCPKTLGVSF